MSSFRSRTDDPAYAVLRYAVGGADAGLFILRTGGRLRMPPTPMKTVKLQAQAGAMLDH